MMKARKHVVFQLRKQKTMVMIPEHIDITIPADHIPGPAQGQMRSRIIPTIKAISVSDFFASAE